ncbi:MAG: B12-binding domain-containing radical SAM protein [Euryarchaeota archaeon]|nr:B12-binding domain-containing radical SAM protein [Euryarchaeota archaeon]MDE2045437.1 B12-binding domain-containing radical SAM protein [Thermoplasmata archaeon]
MAATHPRSPSRGDASAPVRARAYGGSFRARVLLVDPYVRREDPMERKRDEQYPSLGLLSVAAYLRQEGHEVKIVDLTFERGIEPVRRALRSFSPALLGVHTKTLTFPRALALARLARSHATFSIAGGPDASSRPLAYLQGGFDAVGTGEGETTILDVAAAVNDSRSLFGIPGVAFLQEGAMVRGPPRPLVRDLDQLPLPAWDLVDMESYLSRWQRSTGSRRMAVLTSRGCPFDCSWCSKPTFGRTYRQRSVENVLRELRLLQQRYGVDYVRVCDDVFGIQRSWTEKFLDGMVAADLGMRFECLSRVDLLKPQLLPKMAEAGLHRVFLGVESGSQKMLDAMNRGTRLSQIERCASALRAHGVQQYWFLMLGYPEETLDDIERTLQLFRRFSPEEYSISIAVPLPGTRFESTVRERKPPAGREDGGLLYEGVYPVSVYRWQKARFRWSKLLRDHAELFVPEVTEALERAGDEVGRRVVERIVLPAGLPPPPQRGRAGSRRKLRPMVLEVRARAHARIHELRDEIAPELLRRFQDRIPGRTR